MSELHKDIAKRWSYKEEEEEMRTIAIFDETPTVGDGITGQLLKFGIAIENCYISCAIKTNHSITELSLVNFSDVKAEIKALGCTIFVGLGKIACTSIQRCFGHDIGFKHNSVIYLDDRHILLQLENADDLTLLKVLNSYDYIKAFTNQNFEMFLRFRNATESVDIQLHNFYFNKFEKDSKGEFETINGDRVRGNKVESSSFIRFTEQQEIFKVNLRYCRIAYLDVETYFPSQPDKLSIASVLYDGIYYVFADKQEKRDYEVDGCITKIYPLSSFSSFVEKAKFDILCGWNVSFDLGILQKNFKYDLSSIYFLDMLHFYKKIVRESRDNYKLDTIAKIELGVSKLDIDKYKMDTEYINNPMKVIDYNVRDILLLKLLNDKLGMTDFVSQIAEYINTDHRSCEWNSRLFNRMFKVYAKGKVVIEYKYDNGEDLEGGYVLTPEPGLYEDVLVYDMRSLYPSIIQTLNISPETIVKYSDDMIKVPTSPLKETSMKDIKKFILKFRDEYCFKKEQGILPRMVEDLSIEREKIRKTLGGFSKTKENRTLYQKQYAIKVINNSLYGVLGFKENRIFDIRLAGAITAMGRVSLQYMSKCLLEEHNINTIYSDTDSNFIMSSMDPKEIESNMNKYLNNLSDLVGTPFKKLETKFEKKYKSFLIVAKKKYAGIREDGVIDIKGFECIRSDHSNYARKIQRELIEDVLKHKALTIAYPKSAFPLRYTNIRDLAIPKKMDKNIEEYKNKPIHIRAVEYAKIDIKKGETILYLNLTDGNVIAINNMTDEQLEELKPRIDFNYLYENTIKHKIDLIVDIFVKRQRTLFDIPGVTWT